jgi:hypothetical protein
MTNLHAVIRESALPAQLLNDVRHQLERFVIFARPEQATAITLWVAHTWVVDAFDVSPYLSLHSAEKRSGKSRTLDVLEQLVASPWRVALPSEAVTYRKIQQDAPTLLMDEVDAIFRGNRQAEQHEGLRALLNAGFQRGTRVPRCVGPKLELKEFDVFCPKALAGIGSLPDTTADRSIPIRLRRRKPSERVERFRRRDFQHLAEELRERLEEWAVDATAPLEGTYPEMPSEITDRAEEAWEPLVAIADLVGGEWPRLAREAAVALGTGEPDESEQSVGVRLLADVRRVVQDLGDPEKIPTADILAGLHGLEESPWADWKNGKPLSAERLGRYLREYSVKSRDVWTSSGSRKGYLRDQLQDAFDRYLPGSSVSTRDTRENTDGWAEIGTSEPARNTEDIAGSETAQTPMVEPTSRASRVENGKPDEEVIRDIVRRGDELGYPAVPAVGVGAGMDAWREAVEAFVEDRELLQLMLAEVAP